jgi:hypothetical protein
MTAYQCPAFSYPCSSLFLKLAEASPMKYNLADVSRISAQVFGVADYFFGVARHAAVNYQHFRIKNHQVAVGAPDIID